MLSCADQLCIRAALIGFGKKAFLCIFQTSITYCTYFNNYYTDSNPLCVDIFIPPTTKINTTVMLLIAVSSSHCFLLHF